MSELDENPSGSTTATPPTRVRRQVLASVCVLAVITYIHRAGFGSNASELLRGLDMDVRVLGSMTAAFMLAYGFFEVPWGHLADRFGARHLLALIALGGSVMTAGVAAVVLLPRIYAVQLGFLLVMRFLFGLFQAGTFPVLARLMSDWMPTTERASAQGFIWMCSRAGGVLAPMLMIWLFHVLGNWQIPLVLGAGLGIVWCLAVWPWLRSRPDEMPGVNAGELAVIASGRSVRKSEESGSEHAPWSAIFRSWNVWALCTMYGCLGFSGNFFLFLFPTYLQDYRHFNKQTTVWWLNVVPFATGFVACILGGYLSDMIVKRTGNKRLGRRVVGMFGLTLAGVMILVSPWFNDVRWLAVVYGLTFFGNDLAMGPAWAAAGEIGQRFTGTIAGAMNMFASFMAAVSIPVASHFFHGSAVAEKLGDLETHGLYMTIPFLLFAASYFAGALCWLRVDVTEPINEKLVV